MRRCCVRSPTTRRRRCCSLACFGRRACGALSPLRLVRSAFWLSPRSFSRRYSARPCPEETIMLSGFLVALHEVASWNAVFSMVLGMLIGYALGSVPGLTSSIGIALIVPFTFTMSPVDSIVMLVTLYMATEYA